MQVSNDANSVAAAGPAEQTAFQVVSLEDKAKDKEDPYQVPMDVLQMITKDFEPIQVQQQQQQQSDQQQQKQQLLEKTQAKTKPAEYVEDKVLKAVEGKKHSVPSSAMVPQNAVARVNVDADTKRGKTTVSVVPLVRPDAKEVFEVNTCDIKKVTEMLRPMLKER